MRLVHWCMLGVTALLLMCEVVIGHLCQCLITMVDGFQTLFILMHMALPLPVNAAMSSPLPSSVDAAVATSPPQAALSFSSVAGHPLTVPVELTIKSPLANRTEAVSDPAGSGHAADSSVGSDQQSPPIVSPAAPNCGLSYPRSRFQAVGIFFSALLLTSLCTSYLLEIINVFLDPEEVRRPLLLVVAGGVSLLYKMMVFVLNWDRLQGEQVEVLAEQESASRREHEYKAQLSADSSTHSVVLCNPETSSIPDQQQEPEVHRQENRVESSDTQCDSKAVAVEKSLHHDGRRAPVCQLSSVAVLQGLFSSVLALVNSLVMLLVAPQFPHSSEACHPLAYLDPALALLAVVTLTASTLPQVYKYGLLLLQATPPHICVSDIGRRIESVPGVQAVHDLHLWRLNDSAVVASVHVHCCPGFPAHRCGDLMSNVTKVLQSVGVSCCTVQPELTCASSADTSADASSVVQKEDPSPLPSPSLPQISCSLTCKNNCSGSMCCSPLEEEIQSLIAPPGGEAKDEPQTLVIENTFTLER